MTDTKEIPLTQGYVAIVDVADYADLMKFSWSVDLHANGGPYARRSIHHANGTVGNERMHRRLLPGVGMVDHRNGDGLDNRRSNLRMATSGENQQNRSGPQRNNTSGFRGVWWNEPRQKWEMRLGKRGPRGVFATAEEAARAFDAAAIASYGEFAGYLNFPIVGLRLGGRRGDQAAALDRARRLDIEETP